MKHILLAISTLMLCMCKPTYMDPVFGDPVGGVVLAADEQVVEIPFYYHRFTKMQVAEYMHYFRYRVNINTEKGEATIAHYEEDFTFRYDDPYMPAMLKVTIPGNKSGACRWISVEVSVDMTWQEFFMEERAKWGEWQIILNGRQVG